MFCKKDIRPIIETAPLADVEVYALSGRQLVAFTPQNNLRSAALGNQVPSPPAEPCPECHGEGLVTRGDPPVIYDCQVCLPERMAANGGLHPFRRAL